ncbi:MAG: hypothetical protein CBE00_13865 [Planctomycetaceae bacterium TMED240]|nr:MAG: hypothetical protein CBE00_13865 [Planctomycetaceae bacterium TMED240]
MQRGWTVNEKRVHRFWKREHMQVRNRDGGGSPRDFRLYCTSLLETLGEFCYALNGTPLPRSFATTNANSYVIT